MLWKNPESLTGRQRTKLADIKTVNAPLYRAYLLRSNYAPSTASRPDYAEAMLDAWLSWARRSRLGPFVKLSPRLIESALLISRPLGSTATPPSSDLTATTGRSASARRIGTQCLRRSASARSLSRSPGHAARTAVSTLAFSRSVQEPQTGLTPPLRRRHLARKRAPAKLIPKAIQGPPVSMSTKPFDASTATPDRQTARPDDSGTSSRSPPDTVTPRLLPVAHHDGPQPTQHRVV